MSKGIHMLNVLHAPQSENINIIQLGRVLLCKGLRHVHTYMYCTTNMEWVGNVQSRRGRFSTTTFCARGTSTKEKDGFFFDFSRQCMSFSLETQ